MKYSWPSSPVINPKPLSEITREIFPVIVLHLPSLGGVIGSLFAATPDRRAPGQPACLLHDSTWPGGPGEATRRGCARRLPVWCDRTKRTAPSSPPRGEEY